MATLAGQTDALYVYSEPLTNANKDQIIRAANAAKIPTIFGFREFVAAGGLISYGPSFIDLFARAAEFTDKILRGAKPADLPIQQPTKFELVINLKAAKADLADDPRGVSAAFQPAYRIKVLFAAAHESGFGPTRTRGLAAGGSAYQSEPDAPATVSQRPPLT